MAFEYRVALDGGTREVLGPAYTCNSQADAMDLYSRMGRRLPGDWIDGRLSLSVSRILRDDEGRTVHSTPLAGVSYGPADAAYDAWLSDRPQGPVVFACALRQGAPFFLSDGRNGFADALRERFGRLFDPVVQYRAWGDDAFRLYLPYMERHADDLQIDPDVSGVAVFGLDVRRDFDAGAGFVFRVSASPLNGCGPFRESSRMTSAALAGHVARLYDRVLEANGAGGLA